ncbi:MAG TPA: hypothetical protein VD761_01880 [Solirubrobacterales bacterium]|nr:hypothetical protein [Solirubrobacterales bacterium]
MNYVKIPKANHEKALKELKSAHELARRGRMRIHRALQRNEREMKRIRPTLRRAGLLRD